MLKKSCKKCEEEKRLDEFVPDKRQPHGRSGVCKICRNRRARNRRERSPEAHATYKRYHRNYHKRNREHRNKLGRLWHQENRLDVYISKLNYSGIEITKEQYEALLVECDGLCMICGEPETSTFQGRVRRLHVDHEHETGRVRGLLCAACNHGLGKFRDNPELLEAAIAYLEQHNERRNSASRIR